MKKEEVKMARRMKQNFNVKSREFYFNFSSLKIKLLSNKRWNEIEKNFQFSFLLINKKKDGIW